MNDVLEDFENTIYLYNIYIHIHIYILWLLICFYSICMYVTSMLFAFKLLLFAFKLLLFCRMAELLLYFNFDFIQSCVLNFKWIWLHQKGTVNCTWPTKQSIRMRNSPVLTYQFIIYLLFPCNFYRYIRLCSWK